ncbi:MAG: S1 RNA-binding domain-containing protein [Phycisphaerales bacterium]
MSVKTMESNNQSSSPAPENTAPETAPAAEGQATEGAAAPAAPEAKGPNLKGLPKIGRAEVVSEDGRPVRSGPGGPGGGRGGDRGGPRGGGFGKKPAGPESGRAEGPNTMNTLRNVNDEHKASGGGADASLDAEIEAMLAEAGDAMGAKQPNRKGGNVTPVGGARPAALRGPRKVESGREHRKGKVVSVGPTDIFIEFGPKELGVVPRANYERQGEQGQEAASVMPKAGEEIEVVVERFEKDEGLFICSRPGQIVKAAWEMLEVGQTVEARVTGVNKGGLELEVANHRAFMPAGQVSLDRVADLSVFIGEKFPCEIVQIDHRGAGNIVLSRRNMLKQEREEKAAKLRETLVEGAVMDGVVRKIMPFGAVRRHRRHGRARPHLRHDVRPRLAQREERRQVRQGGRVGPRAGAENRRREQQDRPGHEAAGQRPVLDGSLGHHRGRGGQRCGRPHHRLRRVRADRPGRRRPRTHQRNQPQAHRQGRG